MGVNLVLVTGYAVDPGARSYGVLDIGYRAGIIDTICAVIIVAFPTIVPMQGDNLLPTIQNPSPHITAISTMAGGAGIAAG